MKVLIACNRKVTGNAFVRTLEDSLQELGVNAICSLDDFWHSWQKYDIIHLQWPDPLVNGLETIEPLKKHLCQIKESRIPIVITCHNLHPHYSNKNIMNEAYNVVYDMVDCFVHMGSYSYKLLEKRYHHAKHVIIPHHIYDTVYKFIPSREDAMKHLRLDPKLMYVLCFGTFRHDEEREIAIRASEIMYKCNGKVLAPSFFKYKLHKNILVTMEEYIKHMRYKLKYRNIVMSKGYVSDDELPYYYAASDIALIHRKEILNSGNLPMAFYMGKVVVGPNIGNVGAILLETMNPTFNIHNIESLDEALKKAIKLNSLGKGEANRCYAKNKLSSKIIANKYANLYQTLCSNNLNLGNSF